MSFQVSYLSASTSDVVVMPDDVITLVDGQTEATFTLIIVDDDTPEETETLQIELTNVTGDAVLVNSTVATVHIQPSDDPNGEFNFALDSRNISAIEGDTLQIT